MPHVIRQIYKRKDIWNNKEEEEKHTSKPQGNTHTSTKDRCLSYMKGYSFYEKY